ncbi:hypothetical protein RMSM_04250 [Rhodopirellula maiorica SM1]|uniref:Uncharacterized protein n=1 Tax=Rhodopirellula maiorica SM1 TaxID=1265738 RepID=M5RY31_9BACT|nr:hypothetical protein RMSM_04250 [Rhodopirellula maiorica SM1]
MEMVDNRGKGQHWPTPPQKDKQTAMTTAHQAQTGNQQVIHGKNSFESLAQSGRSAQKRVVSEAITTLV